VTATHALAHLRLLAQRLQATGRDPWSYLYAAEDTVRARIVRRP
jgi:hypothetical protein